MIKVFISEFKDDITNKNYIQLLKTLSYVFFCLFVFDCALTGGGHFIMIGSLSPRMIYFAGMVLLAVVPILFELKDYIKNPFILSVIAFIAYLLICAYRGYANGNQPALIFTDLKGFAYLAAVFVAVICIDGKDKMLFVIKVICAAGIIQAVAALAIYMLLCISPSLVGAVFEYLFSSMLATLDWISNVLYRLFFKSSPYLVVACVFLMYKQIISEKFSIKLSVLTGVLLWAILLTFTRSLFGTFAIAALIMVVLNLIINSKLFLTILRHIAISVAVMLVLVFIQGAAFRINYIDFAVERTFGATVVSTVTALVDDQPITEGESEEDYNNKAIDSYFEDSSESDAFRDKMIEDVKASIKKSPFTGNGLGSEIEHSTLGMIEYFYYDIINKTGFLGLLLYCLPMILMTYSYIRYASKDENKYLSTSVLCAAAVFFVATWFNPYMNSSIGISCYSVCIAYFSLFYKDTLFIKAS